MLYHKRRICLASFLPLEMSVEDIRLQSELPSIQAHHKMNSVPKFSPSLEGDRTEQFTDVASDDEESHVLRHCSRASSLCDDSGFNSSASEDRDDIIDRSLRQKCYFDNIKSLVVRNVDIQGHNTQNSLPKSDIQSSAESNITEVLTHSVRNFPVDMKTSNSAISHERSNSVSNRCHRSDVSDNSSVNNISTRNTGRISRRQRTDNRSSQAAPGAPVTPRLHRSRRHRSRDVNNNDSAHNDLNSYLSTPPFKLQDCFQNQGLLSLVACVTYTVVLMIIYCLLGVICDYIKSVVGRQNLRDLRADIVQSRQTRTNMASG